MEWKGIQKKEEGKFITRYDVTYETVDKQEKIYEMISRNKNITSQQELWGEKPDAVVIMATDESGKTLCFKQLPDFCFRVPPRLNFFQGGSALPKFSPCLTDYTHIHFIAESHCTVA